MGGGYDRGEVEAEAAQEQRGARGGKHAAEQRVAAAGRDPRRERRLEHLARLAGVAHDQHLRRLGGRDLRRGAPEREREIGREEVPRYAADAVRAEEAGSGQGR